jgi:hypothetical protein
MRLHGFGGCRSFYVSYAVAVTCVILNRFFHSLVLESEQCAELLRSIEEYGTRAVDARAALLDYGAAKPWLFLGLSFRAFLGSRPAVRRRGIFVGGAAVINSAKID